MVNNKDDQLPMMNRGQKQFQGRRSQGGIPRLQNKHQTEEQSQREHPALFGQSQEHEGLGPIYAVPSFPWHHESDIGPNYAIPPVPWQHSGSQTQGSGQSHHGQWQYGDYQSQSNAQLQQWAYHPYTMMPHYMWYPVGYRCCY